MHLFSWVLLCDLFFWGYLSSHLKASGSGYPKFLNKRCVSEGSRRSHTLWPVASNAFSMQGEAQPTVEGTQLGLEQGPERKMPPLLIETTQIFLSDPAPCFYSKRGEEFLLTIYVSYGNSAKSEQCVLVIHDFCTFKFIAVHLFFCPISRFKKYKSWEIYCCLDYLIQTERFHKMQHIW